jgi:hypothetical protein
MMQRGESQAMCTCSCLVLFWLKLKGKKNGKNPNSKLATKL